MRAILIVALMLLGSAPALAEECQTVDAVKKEFLTGNVKVIAHLKDAESEAFMSAARAQTHAPLEEKEVIVFGDPASILRYVILFKNGCASKFGRFPAPMVDKWLHGVTG